MSPQRGKPFSGLPAVSIRKFGQHTACRGPARTKAEEAQRFMHAGNVQSLVRRTLFEVNSGASHPGNQNLTSAQMARLLLPTPLIVNPNAVFSRRKRARGDGTAGLRHFLSPFYHRETESDTLACRVLARHATVGRPCESFRDIPHARESRS